MAGPMMERAEEKSVGKLKIRRPSILVTNDDGESPGMRMLLDAARRFGDAYAVIPDQQRSAISNAVTLHKPLRLKSIGEGVHTLSGTPADCVLFSLYSKELPKPDLVLSGINAGDNAGLSAIIGSGTLGACWQAVFEGRPAIGFSLRMPKKDWHLEESWGDRAALTKKTEGIIELLLGRLAKDRETFYSVNFPEEWAESEVVETRRLQKERFLTHVDKRLDPDGVPYYWISGSTKKVEKGTDLYEVIEGKKTTITEISLKLFDRGI